MDRDTPLFSTNLKILRERGLFDTLPGIRRGLEKESLRVSPSSFLAQTPHPRSLGASLTHPHITTDYSEALLEFMSTPWTSIRALLSEMHDIEAFTHHCLAQQQEQLWAVSMPCQLPDNATDIPIAQYGSAYVGRIKHIYRQGLGLRYGRKMQTIAGIHYNFSFPDSFWATYQTSKEKPLSDFISAQYFHLMRNALRWRWLLPLWLGASPALDQSFFADASAKMHTLVPGLTAIKTPNDPGNTWISPYATSLRLSPLGYSNTQSPVQHGVSYNGLPDFIADLHKAVTTISPRFAAFGISADGQHYQQLNNTLLQIENEFYGIIRPKRSLQPPERLLHALKQRGVGYIELRAIDLNPFEPHGISKSSLYLLDIFLATCLLLESPPLSRDAETRSAEDYQQVVIQGRKKGLTLPENNQGKRDTLPQRAAPFLEAMQQVAAEFDLCLKTTDYTAAVHIAATQVEQPDTTLSAKVFEAYAAHRNNHLSFGQHYSKAHADYFKQHPPSAQQQAAFEQMASISLNKQQQLNAQTQPPFADYLAHYLQAIH
jgi:glutamate--cysteine ligase